MECPVEHCEGYKDVLKRYQKVLLALSKEETEKELKNALKERSDGWIIKIQKIFSKTVLYIIRLIKLLDRECSREDVELISILVRQLFPSHSAKTRFDKLIHGVTQNKLKSYLKFLLRNLLCQYELQRSSKMMKYEAEEMKKNDEFLKTRTYAEMKLVLLILSFEEIRPWYQNVSKEERQKIQMKAMKTFWSKLKKKSVEKIGYLPRHLVKNLKIWQGSVEKAESDTETLLRDIQCEWEFLDKLDPDNAPFERYFRKYDLLHE